MNKKIKLSLSLIVIFGIVLFGYFSLFHNNNVQGGGTYKVSKDLIGTRMGSTTAAVAFRTTATGGQSATTTYPFFIDKESESVSLALNVVKASSSANVQISIYGSHDFGCNTATTSVTIADILTKSEVNWFDAGLHLANASAPTSFTNGTTTLRWTNPTAGLIKEIILDYLNTECLAVSISASSTEVYAGYKFK